MNGRFGIQQTGVQGPRTKPLYKDFPQSQAELFGFWLFFLDQRPFGEFGVAFD
ncbi:hypothetical protein [Variovorax ginsengisoli]|uniref:Uncharacterized protein n=1 Tax=Variovorax ginsengisoli TaxID=363844 RepID=A0ABT8S7L5_9BURK|nr:hypothetical protein [Variovorax ginsengisoli]MDN8615630.1 hypothetical protein [Variovorax ginsengisoli]MDO1534800.1 hypothetical protein [Variovorax ginsengisoli]